jgi:hypothetical protein
MTMNDLKRKKEADMCDKFYYLKYKKWMIWSDHTKYGNGVSWIMIWNGDIFEIFKS